MMINRLSFFIKYPKAFFSIIYYKLSFGKYGSNSYILKPMSIDNPRAIYIGDNVLIQQYVWLAACSCDHTPAKLIISDGVRLGHFNHIYSTRNIVIEKNVLTADKVYIGDAKHSFDDVTKPIMEQKIKSISKIIIGEGSWIGENVCILGANIGKNCVIGANSVVTHNIPDYSVACGSPAIVIKKYNKENSVWEYLNHN